MAAEIAVAAAAVAAAAAAVAVTDAAVAAVMATTVIHTVTAAAVADADRVVARVRRADHAICSIVAAVDHIVAVASVDWRGHIL